MEETATVTETETSGNASEPSNNLTDSVENVAKSLEKSSEPASSETTPVEGTTQEAAKEPEFANPDMQKRFTQRMQEFSDKEKGIAKREAEYTAGLKKAQAFEALEKDQRVVQYLQKLYGKEKEAMPEITEEQFLEATTDPKKFQAILNSHAKSIAENMLEEKLNPYLKEIEAIKAEHATKALEQDIDDFANAKDSNGKQLYPDFWEYSSDVTQYLEKFKGLPLNSTEKLEMAYKLAKYPNSQRETITKAQNLISSKKSATTEKGGINSNIKKTINKDLTTEEILQQAADSLNW